MVPFLKTLAYIRITFLKKRITFNYLFQSTQFKKDQKEIEHMYVCVFFLNTVLLMHFSVLQCMAEIGTLYHATNN